jgi:hypothetical protein
MNEEIITRNVFVHGGGRKTPKREIKMRMGTIG